MPHRVVIYAKDIMNITGRRERTARKLLSRIRKQYNKQKGAFVTIEEFSHFTGLKEDLIYRFLK